MAPEIIELAGASTKSDIWSVGCTVIELLTGEPPYFDLAPMPALFRIVQDEHPPLPSDISPVMILDCAWSFAVVFLSTDQQTNKQTKGFKRLSHGVFEERPQS